MAQQQVVQQLIEGNLLAVAQAVEDSVDEELHRLEKLTEDDLDALRAKRLDQMRNAARRKQQWLERGHGSYADVRDEKVCDRWAGRLLCRPRVSPPRGARTQEFFAQMKGEERFVCHFYRSSNTPCKVRTGSREGGLALLGLLYDNNWCASRLAVGDAPGGVSLSSRPLAVGQRRP